MTTLTDYRMNILAKIIVAKILQIATSKIPPPALTICQIPILIQIPVLKSMMMKMSIIIKKIILNLLFSIKLLKVHFPKKQY